MPANQRIDLNAEPGRIFGDGSSARPAAAPPGFLPETSGNHHVFVEAPPEKPLGTIMTELRTWLDANKITPLGFSCSIAQTGTADVHLTFGNRSDASLFERTFGLSIPTGAEKKRA